MANIILQEKIRNPQSQNDWITPFYVTNDNNTYNIHINGFLATDKAVNTNNINAKAIVGPKLDESNNIIVDSKIADNAIIGDIYNNNDEYEYNPNNIKIVGNIANNAVQPRNIGKQAIKQYHLAKNAVQGGGLDTNDDNIANASILGLKIKNHDITSTQIAINGIEGDYVDEDEVFHQGNIADDAVSSRNIKEGAVTKNHLQGYDPDTCISTIKNSEDYPNTKKIIFNWRFFEKS